MATTESAMVAQKHVVVSAFVVGWFHLPKECVNQWLSSNCVYNHILRVRYESSTTTLYVANVPSVIADRDLRLRGNIAHAQWRQHSRSYSLLWLQQFALGREWSWDETASCCN